MADHAIERYRRRIEADHNNGLPREEWETLEAIIDGFIKDGGTIPDAATAYCIPRAVLSEWIQDRHKAAQKPKTKRARMKLLIHNGLNLETVKARYYRGESMGGNLSRPAMDPHARAKKAALARWKNEPDRPASRMDKGRGSFLALRSAGEDKLSQLF